MNIFLQILLTVIMFLVGLAGASGLASMLYGVTIVDKERGARVYFTALWVIVFCLVALFFVLGAA